MKSALTKLVDSKPSFAPGTVFAFTVTGEPIPQGSSNSFIDPRTGHKVFKQDKRLAAWRKAVREAAKRFMLGRAPVSKQRGVLLGIEFRLDRTKTTKTGAKRAGSDLDWPVLSVDQDKLVRAVRDSLTGVVYVDDSQVIGSSICDDDGLCIAALPNFKRWTRPGERPGVTIRIALVASAQRALLET